jgi:hypothetical protein
VTATSKTTPLHWQRRRKLHLRLCGSASSATQVNSNNTVGNYSTTNNAGMNNVGNSGSGNIGVNNAAGNFNQQKNNLAIAVSGGRSKPLRCQPKHYRPASRQQRHSDLQEDTLTGTVAAVGVFGAVGKLPSKMTPRPGGYGNNDRGHGGNGGSKDQKATFEAVGAFGLAGVTTQQVLTPDGWKTL